MALINQDYNIVIKVQQQGVISPQHQEHILISTRQIDAVIKISRVRRRIKPDLKRCYHTPIKTYHSWITHLYKAYNNLIDREGAKYRAEKRAALLKRKRIKGRAYYARPEIKERYRQRYQRLKAEGYYDKRKGKRDKSDT